MEKTVVRNNYVEELVNLIRSDLDKEELLEQISNYHENDIADALEKLSEDERKKLYPILGAKRISEIFSYLEENTRQYFDELSVESAAKVISLMDSDDAVDVLEHLEDSKRKEIVKKLDGDAVADVKMILSFDDSEIGSCMTTNFICINNKLTIRQAMSELVKQAGQNDNITTIYVMDENKKFFGAIDLKDLIIAREYDKLDDLISHSYPFVYGHEKI